MNINYDKVGALANSIRSNVNKLENLCKGFEAQVPKYKLTEDGQDLLAFVWGEMDTSIISETLFEIFDQVCNDKLINRIQLVFALHCMQTLHPPLEEGVVMNMNDWFIEVESI